MALLYHWILHNVYELTIFKINQIIYYKNQNIKFTKRLHLSYLPLYPKFILISYIRTAEGLCHLRLQYSKLLFRRLEYSNLFNKCLVSNEDLISMHLVRTCSDGILYYLRKLKRGALQIIAKVKSQSNL